MKFIIGPATTKPSLLMFNLRTILMNDKYSTIEKTFHALARNGMKKNYLEKELWTELKGISSGTVFIVYHTNHT